VVRPATPTDKRGRPAAVGPGERREGVIRRLSVLLVGVLMVAVGTSAPLAQDAAYRFLTLGVSASAPLDVHTQHVAAGLLGKEDVCLAVSHSGATVETVNTVEAARDAGATTIAITSYAQSPLTQLVDMLLVAGGPEMSFRLEAMASRLAHMTVLDALYVAVALTSQERARVHLDATADVLAKHRY
jgi:RpiR family transcriptional regulator, carbohydrate utilization regulator